MSDCDNCNSKENCAGKEDCSKSFPKYGNIKNVVGIISGKGGVGKSTVTGILAIELVKAGYKVGVLDGDITGPSMPRFFGINDKRAEIYKVGNTEEVKIMPVETELGIKVMSLNLITEKEEQPVIWRGPIITGALDQMYTDTAWGDLDYLLIDMPPGTGDVALTVMQSLPVEGMLIVSTPQDMVSMIVKKVVIMVEKLDVNIVGVVENMSYIKCNNCGEMIRIFSKKSAEEQAKYLGYPLILEMPMNLELSESLNLGKAEQFVYNSDEYKGFADNFIKELNR